MKIEQEIFWIFKEKYGEKWRPGILKDIKRLKAGEPVDYIIGWMPFLNSQIGLSLKPLIPRPETEYWAEKVIEKLKNRDIKKPRVLDIFAGSGCVGIAILKNVKNAQVDFAEVNPKFVQQIKINLKLNKIPAYRYRVIQSDIFRNIKKRYDYILANPPYIPLKNKKRVQAEVLKYEPRSAIFGGRNGLFYVKKFLTAAPRHLNSGGEIWMEFDSPQKIAIEKLLQKQYYEYQIYKDQYKKWRYVKINPR